MDCFLLYEIVSILRIISGTSMRRRFSSVTIALQNAHYAAGMYHFKQLATLDRMDANWSVLMRGDVGVKFTLSQFPIDDFNTEISDLVVRFDRTVYDEFAICGGVQLYSPDKSAWFLLTSCMFPFCGTYGSIAERYYGFKRALVVYFAQIYSTMQVFLYLCVYSF